MEQFAQESGVHPGISGIPRPHVMRLGPRVVLDTTLNKINEFN